VNKKQSQSGSSHLVIIIVLVVALLGALGYVFYLNFMQPKSTPAPTPAVAVVSTPTETNAGYLVLDDWDVKFKLLADLGSNEITYQRVEDSYGQDMYQFSTERASALGGDCNNLVRILRSVSSTADGPEIPVAKIGSYYYFVSGRQSACSEPLTDAIRDITYPDRQMLKTFVASVELK